LSSWQGLCVFFRMPAKDRLMIIPGFDICLIQQIDSKIQVFKCTRIVKLPKAKFVAKSLNLAIPKDLTNSPLANLPIRGRRLQTKGLQVCFAGCDGKIMDLGAAPLGFERSTSAFFCAFNSAIRY